MPEVIFDSFSPEETIQRGRELGMRIRAPAVILLSGELGAGKTTLAKGIIHGMDAAEIEEICSPSFTLVHVFHGRSKVYHVDLYRAEGPQDLESLGLEDIFQNEAIVIIEWPERLCMKWDWPSVRITMDHVSMEERLIKISDSSGVLHQQIKGGR